MVLPTFVHDSSVERLKGSDIVPRGHFFSAHDHPHLSTPTSSRRFKPDAYKQSLCSLFANCTSLCVHRPIRSVETLMNSIAVSLTVAGNLQFAHQRSMNSILLTRTPRSLRSKM